MIKFVYSLDEQTMKETEAEIEANGQRLDRDDYQYLDGLFQVQNGATIMNRDYLVSDYILIFITQMNQGFIDLGHSHGDHAQALILEGAVQYNINRAGGKLTFEVSGNYRRTGRKLFSVSEAGMARVLRDANTSFIREINVRYPFLLKTSWVRQYFMDLNAVNKALDQFI
jgi:hypothetical protein